MYLAKFHACAGIWYILGVFFLIFYLSIGYHWSNRSALALAMHVSSIHIIKLHMILEWHNERRQPHPWKAVGMQITQSWHWEVVNKSINSHPQNRRLHRSNWQRQIMQTLNVGGVFGPLCYKLITIVGCYLGTGLSCIVYWPKSYTYVHYHWNTAIVISTWHCYYKNWNCKQIVLFWLRVNWGFTYN